MTYVVDPQIILAKIRDLSMLANQIKSVPLPVGLITFGESWKATAYALELSAVTGDPMTALRALGVLIEGKAEAEKNLAKTLGIEAA